MASIPFSKVEGLGNDFVVVDLRPGQPAADAADLVQSPATVRAICDRHFGVGADGVLAVLPGDTGQARMRVLNADGSEAEMCGNGIRCVAKVLYESDPKLRRPVIEIDTGAGLLACTIHAEGARAKTVAVEMGRPRLTRGEIPLAGPASERALRAPVTVDGRTFTYTGVSMGNPHAVIFVDGDEDLRSLAKNWGPKLEVAPEFPRKANIEFARIRNDGGSPAIDLWVWERGAGLTLACGTGACATAVAAALEGRLPADRELPVWLPGGPLFITVHTEKGAPSGVLMRGPAETVFEAELDVDALLTRKAGS